MRHTYESAPSGENAGTCPECLVGVMQLEYLTYFTWLHGELVTVPNFPAWVCDVCGKRDYDLQAIGWLNTILSHDSKPPPTVRHRRPTLRDADQPSPGEV